MTILVAAIALTMSPQHASVAQQESTTAEEVATTLTVSLLADAQQAARDFLELLDAGDWQASYDMTDTSFRQLNTLAVWTSVSEKSRRPLGNAITREPLSMETLPTPEGYVSVKFETQFAGKADTATETVTLVEEDGIWEVVGVFID